MGFKMVWTNTEPNHPSIRVKINAITSGHFIVGLWEKYLIAKKRAIVMVSPTKAPNKRLLYSIQAKTILN